MHAESVVVVSHALNIAFSLFLSWSSEWQRLRPLFGHSRLLCTGIVRYWFVFYNLLMYIVLSSVFRGWAMAPPRRYTVKNGISNLFQTNCVVTMASPSLKSWLRHWLWQINILKLIFLWIFFRKTNLTPQTTAMPVTVSKKIDQRSWNSRARVTVD